ncbi:UDP-N-acetylmuramate--L-alanine ligase [Phnomibacter sp. MR]|uniref:UDP-N-acetylmuramate--L-alanine ligase n=1 Tax=Phnomibacter sp. MR TaxID=3042318 RepID=UPI003A80E91F
MTIHFISIGGSVMHQLALALHHKGYTITGSDDEIFEPAKNNLAAAGLLPAQIGWFESNIHSGLDAVILGMHARADNPELLKAQALGIPVYSFPEYIFQESKTKQRIVVGGSHGKTTTTSMIMHALQQSGLAFDYLVGAKLPGFSQSVQVTNAPIIVCEGDEYPASVVEKRPKFHFLFPHVAILTGIAWDHINVFPTFDFYLEQFSIFIQKIEPGGVLIYNQTDETLHALVQANLRSDIRFIPYGVPAHRIDNGATVVLWPGAETAIKVFGNHNLLNMEAARLACAEAGVSTEQFAAAIGSFTGASKRLEVLLQNEHTTVYRDFAHAPSKVKATIDAVKQQFPNRKLIALLELHTYSSLNADFMPHYQQALDAADEAAVYYSQHALEIKKMPPLDKQVVANGFAKPGLQVLNDARALQQWMEQLQVNDASVLLMSSGTFEGINLLELFGGLMQLPPGNPAQ